MLEDEGTLHVPAIFLAEVASALRSMLGRGELTQPRAEGALAAAGKVARAEYPFAPFSERAWELRGNLTIYDAWYVALAEYLEVPFVTADARLIDATGPRCTIARP